MKTKILYVIPTLERAGAENHLMNILRNLDRNTFEAAVCCVMNLGALGTLFEKAGGDIICLNRKNIYDPRIAIDIYRLIKKHGFNIVHGYLFGFDYLAIIPARLAGVPVKISSRRELATWKRFHHRLLGNIANYFTNTVVACSEAAREFALKWESLIPDKIITIHNGVDLDKFCPRPKNPRLLEEFGFDKKDDIVGMVTKFAEVKDNVTALEAINEAVNICPQSKYLLVGDGHLRKEVEGRVRSLKLDKNVRFAGLREDIAEIFSIMDIHISSSLSEGLPNVILEAMASGKPVISTNVGGIPEAVENGKNGILIKPRDHAAFADAIIKLLENASLRKEMGKRGREIVEKRFSLNRMVQDYGKLYGKR